MSRSRPLLESVPNFSEGRRTEVVDRLATAVDGDGAVLLDRSSDRDHHRTVLTLAGPPQALERALLRLYEGALAAVDLRNHQGVHPRVGAVDVVPFVPLGDTPMEVARRTAERLAATVAERFELPVYLYGQAARQPEHRVLADVRRGGLAGLGRRMASDPRWRPDAGPHRLHPRAGATVVGARFFLIAFNVVLTTADLEAARVVARAVRESSGGLPALQAIGVPLAEDGRVQVSMNLLDYRQTSLPATLAAVRQAARRLGTDVAQSEIVGLVPRAAVAGLTPEDLLQPGPFPVLEDRLRERFGADG
jgi:glutamate formiminotransferase